MLLRRCSAVLVAVAALTAGSACLGSFVPSASAATLPTVSIGGGSVVEGQMTHRYIKFTVSLSMPSTNTVTVQYATSDGDATAGPDYHARSGTLTFTPKLTSKYFAVTVWPDRTDEQDETFNVTLSNPTNATIGVGTGTATIIDDDPNVGPKVSIGDSIVPETCSGVATRAVVVVTLSIMQNSPVVVQVDTAPGTATAGADYTSYSKQITFTSSQNLKEVRIPIIADTDSSEGSEQFTVNLSVVSGPIGASKNVGTVTILDCMG